MSLSNKIRYRGMTRNFNEKGELYEEDVAEFIKRLKDEFIVLQENMILCTNENQRIYCIRQSVKRVDKLAGSKLTDSPHNSECEDTCPQDIKPKVLTDTNPVGKLWDCLICKETVGDNQLCKCMRDAKPVGEVCSNCGRIEKQHFLVYETKYCHKPSKLGAKFQPQESESYGKDWITSTIHLNKKTGEIHSDSNHEIREYLTFKPQPADKTK